MEHAQNPIVIEFLNTTHERGHYKSLVLLNSLTEDLKQLPPSQVIPELIAYIQNKQYIHNDRLDRKLLSVCKILSHFKDPNTLAYLIALLDDEKVIPYFEDIITCIGSFKSEAARRTLVKHLRNKHIAYRSAIVLAEYPDASGESVLIEALHQSLSKENFLDEIVYALVKLRNTQLWNLLDTYIQRPIPEKERYKVCLTLLNVDHSRTIPLLIHCYDYYCKHPEIDYKSVKSISFESEKLSFGRASKKVISFSDKIKLKITDKLKGYQSDFKVKSWLRDVQAQKLKSLS